MYQTSFEICPFCHSLITEEEYVVNWGGCGECLSASYEHYIRTHPEAMQNLDLDFESDFDYNGSQ